ncbi:prolyl-tRNA ligase [Advenella kashmirensis WT001]|uniref:Proline--tRNA ligase n=1 Tax=Advenella kashmirensis (strain DSM 17095 / LMG 22695 / WT001) TaxID=1036672 RepID=I3UF38_ADVKW|nr:proline--tRNA ligase [Advenella kashmirensis]AFK63626.1 prolyl-tRNA ligase [Advenella kashmirensis WT001]
MLASKFHLNTLKEAPAEAEIISHQLMTRAGMIRKHAGGIYTYMPLALKTLRKVENIVREEMNRAGAIELLMPVVQPAELWMESGRWVQYGAELLRIKDRHQRDFVLQPTSEEVVTDIARNEIHSWRQLPVNFYHIQTKFRDERRPRFGLMRGREFTMKDAYSFDRDEASAQASYDAMYDAYVKIFSRLGLTFRAVAADTGSIGGDRSHEFQVIADTGEDLIVYNPDSQYAANIELADAPCLLASRAAPTEALREVATPGASKCEIVAEQLNVSLEKTVKAVVFMTTPKEGAGQLWLLMVRGDHEVNEVKIGKLPAFKEGYRMATEEEIMEYFGSKPGFLGPVKPIGQVHLLADRTVANMADFICGANREDYHYAGVNWGRDLPEPEVADLRNVVEGDPATDGPGRLAIQRGIEVGHVFFLGDKYSEKLKATFLNEQGKPEPLQMGCYGIGISRIMAAAIEQNHDAKGIIWPLAMAPFEVVICPIGLHKSEAVQQQAQQLYDTLRQDGIDVILDDRDVRPGVMFSEWELIGVPIRITIGDRGLKDGIVELQSRSWPEGQKVPVAEMLTRIKSLYNELKNTL